MNWKSSTLFTTTLWWLKPTPRELLYIDTITAVLPLQLEVKSLSAPRVVRGVWNFGTIVIPCLACPVCVEESSKQGFVMGYLTDLTDEQ